MSRFADVIQERKRKNQLAFESSFTNLSESVFMNHEKETDPYKIAIAHVIRHYKISGAHVPNKINDLARDLDGVVASKGLLTREIELEGSWLRDNSEPIIAFTKENRTPVALLPRGSASYILFLPKTGKKMRVTSSIVSKLESTALTFYRPLPKKKLTFKDYTEYIKKAVRPLDVAFIFVLMAAVTVLGMIHPYLLRKMTGEVIANQDMALFWSTVLMMTGAYVGLILMRATQAIINARISIKIENSIHSAIMMRTLSLPTSFFKKHSAGELNARISAIPALYNLIINGIVITTLTALFSLVYLVQINDFSSKFILPTLGIVLANVVFITLLSFVERNVMRKQTLMAAGEKGMTYGLISGIQKIRLTGGEKRAFVKWSKAYVDVARAKYNPPFIIKIAPVISLFISVAGNVLLYYLVGRFEIDSATYVAFSSSYGVLSGALMALTSVINNAAKIKPMQEMITPILEEEPESDDTKINVETISGNIRINNVSFRYDDESPMVLDNLSLQVDEGEYVAIVGKTGCGKSTIVRLLLGFEKPLAGSIYYDDYNVEDVNLTSLRKKIGSVTQNGTLFHADILSNIIISAPELKEKDAWEAAKIANIDQDIKEMPMGMKTVISEGQGGVSGGQKQRIMIARAVVNKPKVIIFDEATSSLDNESQKIVSDAIGELNCTRIVIAHRLSTIKNCDRIFLIDEGRISEEGTYDELIKKNGKFKELIDRQRLE